MNPTPDQSNDDQSSNDSPMAKAFKGFFLGAALGLFLGGLAGLATFGPLGAMVGGTLGAIIGSILLAFFLYLQPTEEERAQMTSGDDSAPPS